MNDADLLELTILMPCLNEAETLAACIDKARGFLASEGIRGEVLVADNGSTDDSTDIARSHGARVIDAPVRGYGAALLAGIQAARSRYVIMGDADDSYDFSQLAPFVSKLRSGCDLVMGNRFKGGIAPGAMPFLHKYLGNPVLSFVGRLFFKVPIGDFHCGLRGFDRKRILSCNLSSTGMEFASEMVVRAALCGLSIAEVPTPLRPDGRSRAPHLNTWRDGWRHLRLLLLFSPKWLFFYPSIVLLGIGLIITLALLTGPVAIAPHVVLDVHSMVVGGFLILIGTQGAFYSIITQKYAAARGFLPIKGRVARLLAAFTLEKILGIVVVLAVCGMSGFVYSVWVWYLAGFGPLAYGSLVRVLIASGTALALAAQIALTAFLSEVIKIGQPL